MTSFRILARSSFNDSPPNTHRGQAPNNNLDRCSIANPIADDGVRLQGTHDGTRTTARTAREVRLSLSHVLGMCVHLALGDNDDGRSDERDAGHGRHELPRLRRDA